MKGTFVWIIYQEKEKFKWVMVLCQPGSGFLDFLDRGDSHQKAVNSGINLLRVLGENRLLYITFSPALHCEHESTYHFTGFLEVSLEWNGNKFLFFQQCTRYYSFDLQHSGGEDIVCWVVENFDLIFVAWYQFAYDK